MEAAANQRNIVFNYNDAVDERSGVEMRRYVVEREAGHGTFGTVQLGRDRTSGATVAIKRVIQDPRFRNRELQIMQELARLHHPNVIQLQTHFFTRGEKRSDIYLNVVMDFMPDTLFGYLRHFYRNNREPPLILTKLFMYELLRSIACLHLPSVNVCHRDIKPHNVLVNEAKGTLKLCDFGSAKKLTPSEPNVAYICSRYYRAPELIFDNQFYTTAVDVWSVGCIFAEMMLGAPIFRGFDSAGQIREIIKVLGRPSREELKKLNKTGVEIPLPEFKPVSWTDVIKRPQPPEAFDLLNQLLKYLPEERMKPLEALCHPYFDALHNPQTKLPNGSPLPDDLFTFLPQELEAMTDAQKEKLVKKK